MTKTRLSRVFLPATHYVLPLCILLLSSGHAWSAPLSTRVGFAVLEQPALMSAKAAHQAMLAVTRAGERLVAVGEQGVVLLSDDHGASWRQARVPVSVSLTAVRFVDERTGWAVGHLGVVLHTRDGGETWVKQLDGIAAAALVLEDAEACRASLAAYDAGGGEGRCTVTDTESLATSAAAHDKAVESAERALRGARRLLEEGPDKPFLELHFLDARTGFVFGAYNLIFRTEDGGRTWRPWQHRVPNRDGAHLYGMAGSKGVLILVGEQGLLLRSTDGGEHFEPLDSPYEGSFFGVMSAPGGGFIAYGLRGHVFHSGDGGESWSQVETGQSESLSAGTALSDGSPVLVSQAGEALVSRDGGRSFQRVPELPALPFAGIIQAADGALVGASLMGVHRLGGLSRGTR